MDLLFVKFLIFVYDFSYCAIANKSIKLTSSQFFCGGDVVGLLEKIETTKSSKSHFCFIYLFFSPFKKE